MKLFLLMLLLGTAHAAPAKDDLSRTLAACGKPLSAADTPAAEMAPGAKLRILTYASVKLHFVSGRGAPTPGYSFTTAEHDGRSFPDRAALNESLPCFGEVLTANSTLPDRSTAAPATKLGDYTPWEQAIRGLVLLFVIGFFYLLPCVVAGLRGVENSGGIIVVNLLLGWTILGWIVALAWAASSETKAQAASKRIDYNRLAAAASGRRYPDPPMIDQTPGAAYRLGQRAGTVLGHRKDESD